MPEHEITVMSGVIFDDSTEISIVELCKMCSVETALVEQLIDEGIIEPRATRDAQPRFPYSSVRRTQTVVHLQRDLGVNLAGAALALELLERLEKLRTQLRQQRESISTRKL